MKNISVLICLGLFFGINTTAAQIRLPQLVRDSMILQRDTKINIWGWASPNEKVEIGFLHKKYNTRADAGGRWQVHLPPLKAGGPYQMSLKGKNNIVLHDILIGDVWLCSGQSNMVHQMELHKYRYAADIQQSTNPKIRQFWIPSLTDLQNPQPDFPLHHVQNPGWKSANPYDVLQFSAVAYFFANALYEKYHIPIGIINASVGGTPIEAWTSEEGLKQFPAVDRVITKNKDTAYVNGVNRQAQMERIEGSRKPEQDKGLMGPVKWYDPSYVPKEWYRINIPGYWDDQGIRDLNGSLWYRREIIVPEQMAGKPATIFMGRIVDADYVYINGRLTGNTTYQYPQRRYQIPPDVLKPGKNLIVIRVINYTGKGGFVPDKPYYIFTDKDTLDLKGYWDYKVGEVFAPHPSPSSISIQNQPTALYNAMIAPLTNFALKGVLWYQGESNTDKAEEYASLLPALIGDWREKWSADHLPFIYVQLPGFMDVNYLPEESQWATLRDAQLKTLSVPQTGMAITIDLGEWNDIHPLDKKDVGVRSALVAERVAYGDTGFAYSGPVVESVRKEENKMIIRFKNVGNGLVSHDGEPLRYFAIAGNDKKFVWANAEISGNTVVVWSDSIPDPEYVRYAWADNPRGANLYNNEGLPASPFEIRSEP